MVRIITAALLLSGLWMQTDAHAGPDIARATQRCEEEVTATVKRMRGREAQEVQFLSARRVLTPQGDDETSIRGEGRYRSAGGASVGFTYGCAYDASSDATSGVVFRENPGQRAAATEKTYEPDLTNLSPQACESAVAVELKRQHPRVARINFGSDSRRLEPAEFGRVEMSGAGSVERAPGMNLIPFRYRCELEPRSGRVVAASITE